MKGLEMVYPSYAKIDVATAATHVIISAPAADKRICIFTIFVKSTASNTVTWVDGSTNITGAIAEAANSGEVVRFNPEKPLMCGLGNAFSLIVGSAAQVSGVVIYAIMG